MLQGVALTAGVAAADTAAGQDGSTRRWPQYQFDAANSGFVPSREGPRDPVEAWTKPVGRVAQRGAAVVDSQQMYVGTLDGTLYALQRESGATVWTADVGDRIRSAVAVDGDHVYVGSENRTLYALDASSGDEVWVARFDAPVVAGPTLVDGRLLAVAETIRSFDPSTGTQQWTTPIRTATGPPSSDGRQAFVGTNRGITAVDLATGRRTWQFGTGTYVYPSPAVGDRGVYGIDVEGNLYALATDGSERWRHSFGDRVDCSPAVDGDRVYASGVGSLWAFDPATGAVEWEHDLGNDVYWNSPIVTDDTVFVGTGESLHAVDAASGEERWIDDDGAYWTPTLVDGRLYTATEDSVRVVADASSVEASSPSATITGRIVTERRGESVVISASESSVTEGEIVRYEWAVGEDSGFDRSGAEIRLARSTAEANPLITLRLTTNTGATETTRTVVTAPARGEALGSGTLSPWWQGGVVAGIVGGGSLGGYLHARRSDVEAASRTTRLDGTALWLVLVSWLCFGAVNVVSLLDGSLPVRANSALIGLGTTAGLLTGLCGSALLGRRASRPTVALGAIGYGVVVTSYGWVQYVGSTLLFPTFYHMGFWAASALLAGVSVARITSLGPFGDSSRDERAVDDAEPAAKTENGDPDRQGSDDSETERTDGTDEPTPASDLVADCPEIASAAPVDLDAPVHVYEGRLTEQDDEESCLLSALAPELARDDDAVSAFVGAAQRWRALDEDARVATVYDSGAQPRPWIAFDPGTARLAETVDSLDRSYRTDVVLGLTEAVQADDSGVHTSLSPGAVCLTTGEEDDLHVTLADWGLRSAVAEAAGDRPITPYTAPEQLDAEPLGPATEVYRLGAVTYHVLTGTAPFADVDEPRDAILDGDLAAPTEIERTLLPAVDEILGRAMAVDPEERFETPGEFRGRLTDAMDPSSDE